MKPCEVDHNWGTSDWSSSEHVKLNTFLITFNFHTILSSIRMGLYNVKVSPYVPNPVRCFKCQKFGHGNGQCKRMWGWPQLEHFGLVFLWTLKTFKFTLTLAITMSEFLILKASYWIRDIWTDFNELCRRCEKCHQIEIWRFNDWVPTKTTIVKPAFTKTNS
jgi:hypothetical protein